MISETLLLITHLEIFDTPIVSRSSTEPSFPREISFKPQEHEYIKREDGVYIKFYGPMSPEMEYFIEREKAHNKRIADLEKGFHEKALSIRGYSVESLEPHYFFPTITTASDEPVNVAEVEPIE